MGEKYNSIIMKPDDECTQEEIRTKFHLASEAGDFENMPPLEKAYPKNKGVYKHNPHMNESYNKIIMKPDQECTQDEIRTKFHLASEAGDWENMPPLEKAYPKNNGIYKRNPHMSESYNKIIMKPDNECTLQEIRTKFHLASEAGDWLNMPPLEKAYPKNNGVYKRNPHMNETYNKIIMKPDKDCTLDEIRTKFHLASEAGDWDNMPALEKAYPPNTQGIYKRNPKMGELYNKIIMKPDSECTR